MPHSVSSNIIKVSILGAAGGIGQSLSLLLKTQLNTYLGDIRDCHIHLALYDVNQDAVNGFTADLSHIDTPVTVSSHSNATPNGIRDCLLNTDLILIPAGVPRKPGMTREDLLHINAKIIKQLSESIAMHADLTRVFILVISNPVNSLVPVMIERLYQYPEAAQTEVEKRVFGITNLDLVRASTFLHEMVEMNNPATRSSQMPDVPVIGGHSGETIMPLFSMAEPAARLSIEQRDHLIHRVQFGGDEIVKAKNGLGSATLAMAHAAFKVAVKFLALLTYKVDSITGIFYVSLLNKDKAPISLSANKLLPLISQCAYFSVPVTIKRDAGITDVDYGIVTRMDAYERKHMLPLCLSKLRGGIETGIAIGSAE